MALEKLHSCGKWVGGWISRRADITPSWVALKDEGEDKSLRFFTYNELDDQSSSMAFTLKELYGISKGDSVAVLSWNRAEVVLLILACGKIGCSVVPVNTRYTSKEIVGLIKESSAKLLLCEDPLCSKVPEGDFQTIPLSSFLSSSSGKKEIELEELCLEDTLLLLETGGTTGKPKLAKISHRMILWNAMNTLRDLIVPGDVTIETLPLFHIGAYTYLFPLLMFGGTNIIMRRWDIERFAYLVNRERPSFLFLVPTQLRMLISSGKMKEIDFSSARWITSGGGALTQDLIMGGPESGIIVKQGFGMTEMGPGIFALDPWDALRKAGSIGKPNLLIEAKIKEGGKAGELMLRGPSIFSGYVKEELTEELISDGWMLTGDIVNVDDEGYFYVMGRKKNVIRSGEESVYPEEVERILLQHPSIAEAVVIGVRDEKWGEVPKAVIVLKEGKKICREEIESFLKERIAKYKVPKYYEVVPSLPLNEAGKVSREMVKRMYSEPTDNLGC